MRGWMFVGPATSALSTSTMSPGDETAKYIAMAAVAVGVVVAGVALACGVACCYRRMYCPSWLLGRRGSRKRRVVVMHSNSLYDGDAGTKHHQQAHPHHQHQQQQLAFLMPPRVKVETSSTRASRRRFLSTVLEYEIPLDPLWEFPRDKSVAVSAFKATSSKVITGSLIWCSETMQY